MEQSLNTSFQLEPLHADSLIWTQKTIQPEQDFHLSLEASIIKNKSNKNSQSNTNKFNQKDDILSYIKPDYGSLGQFITGVNLTTDFIKQKKKKYDCQEDSQEKRIKTHLQNKNLNKVLANPNSSPQERNVACKLFVEKSFEQAFGSSINEFYQQQTHKLEPQYKKGSLNLSSLSDALDEIVKKSHEPTFEKPNHNLLYLKESMRKNRSFLRDKTEFINQKQAFLKKLASLKSNYRSLQKNSIPEQPPNQYKQWEQKYPGNKQSRTLFNVVRQSQSSELSRHQSLRISRDLSEKVFIVNEKQVIMSNLTDISSETVLYILSKVNFLFVQEVTISKSSFSNSDAFNLFLDLLGMEGKNLQALVIQELANVQQKKFKEKFCQKLKTVLEVSAQSLLILKLNSLSLQTKDFCMLCLGIGSTRKLQQAQLKNNNIDEHAKKSFDVLIKFFKNLQINLEGNPINNEIIKYKGKSTASLAK